MAKKAIEVEALKHREAEAAQKSVAWRRDDEACRSAST
jgi:hypothetical protein